MRNRALFELFFAEPRLMEEVIDAAICLTRLIEILGDRPQNIDALWVDAEMDESAKQLDVSSDESAQPSRKAGRTNPVRPRY